MDCGSPSGNLVPEGSAAKRIFPALCTTAFKTASAGCRRRPRAASIARIRAGGKEAITTHPVPPRYRQVICDLRLIPAEPPLA
jgi:hypothetical protein